jgi:hypothetical protein
MALSCSDCTDNWHSIHLIHDFYLEWELHPRTQHITIGSWNCGVGGNEIITDQTIYATGYDSAFIIAKSHPDDMPAIKKRLFVDTNSRGDYSLQSPVDSQYLDDEKEYLRKYFDDNEIYHDSIYQQNGKWYHTRKEWFGSPDGLYLDKTKTVYYIINIKNYSGMWQMQQSISKYYDEDSFIKARKELGVPVSLDFTIITKKLE